jgi:hypothetical protein
MILGVVWGVLYIFWNTEAQNRRGLDDKPLQVWEQMTLSYMETKRYINIAWRQLQDISGL